jgi:CheY-like chemotaxis protein
MRELGIGTYISKPARQSQLRECLRDLIYSEDGAGDKAQRDAIYLSEVANDQPIKVLVVEDDAVNLDVVSSMLAGMNCIVTPAYDGQQAVTLASTKPFDLIFMDCQLPVLDGFSAAGRIKDSSGPNSHTPLVALTAKAMPGDRERCIDAGMQDYLSKPVRQAQLISVLNKWVSGKPSANEAESIDINRPDIDLSDEAKSTVVELKPVAKAVAEPAEPDSIINMAAIDKIRELQRPGKEDLLTKVLNLYFTKTPEQLAQLKDAVEQENHDEVKSVLHAMKSSSAYLGAQKLASTCSEIETLITQGETTDVARLAGSIFEQYELVQDALQQHVKAA